MTTILFPVLHHPQYKRTEAAAPEGIPNILDHFSRFRVSGPQVFSCLWPENFLLGAHWLQENVVQFLEAAR